MKENKKETFKVKKNDAEVVFAVNRPTPRQLEKAQLQYNIALQEAIKDKALLRATVNSLLREQGLWNDEKDKKVKDLISQIRENERALKEGGIKLSKGREIALKTRRLREELVNETSVKNDLDGATAEARAENRRFDYLLTQCLVYNDSGKPYFENLEAYTNYVEEDEVPVKGARILAAMIFGYDKDLEKKLPENKFLQTYKFVDENLRFINKDGKLVNEDGQLINEDGRLINEDGQLIDINGSPINEDGESLVESKPFIDDLTGQPVA